MRDWIELGSSPCEEECVQLDTKVDYLPKMRQECHRFLNLIREKLGPEPVGAKLGIKQFAHDFGPYLEVVCFIEDTIPEAVAYAFKCESESPTRWNI